MASEIDPNPSTNAPVTATPALAGRAASCRTILRSSAVMGSTTLVAVLAGLLRMKVAALVLGPAGVGLVGLCQSLLATASGVASLGLDGAATRQVACAAASPRGGDLEAVRSALFGAAVVLAIVGAVALFAAREVVAAGIFDDPLLSDEVGWLAAGVALAVAAGAQRAYLNGLRRTGDLAKLQALSALAAAFAGILALLSWQEGAVVVFVLAAPLAAFLVGQHFVAHAPRGQAASPVRLRALVAPITGMARLGAALMVGGISLPLAFLAVRSLVQHELGASALGQFQAAFAISGACLGLILSAMAVDFYPRLTAALSDARAATRLVNEQVEVGLLLAGPVMVALLAAAPLVVRILYSADFAEAADILRWQVTGDVLKVAGWPLGFVLVAAGEGRTFALLEIAAALAFVSGAALGLPFFGVEATGIAVLLMYAVYLPLVHRAARNRIGFSWERPVLREGLLLAIACGLVMVLAAVSDWVAVLAGLPIAALYGLHSTTRLGRIAGLDLAREVKAFFAGRAERTEAPLGRG